MRFHGGGQAGDHLGVVTNDGITTLGGLEGGELIVSAGANSLVEGQKVRFLEKQ